MRFRGNVRRFLAGACLLPALAGCARLWFPEREPWRREAELACLQSGAVKEGPAVAIVTAINGPGVCGADYPLRVMALGDPALVGFADEAVRPPEAAVSPSGGGAARGGYAQAAPPDDYPRARPQGLPVESVPLGRPDVPITGAPAALIPAATLGCPLVSALDRFVIDSVQPAALRWFGQPVVEIRQIAAYSCRGRIGDGSGKISEHAFGNALDIAAFTLRDGRKITVKDGWHGRSQEQGFLRDVESGACQRFTTVLAPGSNASHTDHIHVDLRKHAGRDICDPKAVSGELIATQARSHEIGMTAQ
jgi:hypothetical protein